MGLPHKGLFRQGAIVIESFRIDGRELQIFAYSIAMMTEQEFIKSQLSQVPLSECNRINSMNLWVGVEVLYALDIHNNERLSGHFIGEVAEGLGGVLCRFAEFPLFAALPSSPPSLDFQLCLLSLVRPPGSTWLLSPGITSWILGFPSFACHLRVITVPRCLMSSLANYCAMYLICSF